MGGRSPQRTDTLYPVARLSAACFLRSSVEQHIRVLMMGRHSSHLVCVTTVATVPSRRRSRASAFDRRLKPSNSAWSASLLYVSRT